MTGRREVGTIDGPIPVTVEVTEYGRTIIIRHPFYKDASREVRIGHADVARLIDLLKYAKNTVRRD